MAEKRRQRQEQTGKRRKANSGPRPVVRRQSTSNRKRPPVRTLRERLPSRASLQSVGKGLWSLVKRIFPTIALAACIAGIATGGMYAYEWFTHSPRFDIANLKISGNDRVGEAEIHELLSLPERSNLFLTDTDRLEAQVLASPWISYVDISRDYPNTLEIVIHEETAAAVIDVDGLYLVNAQGQAFKATSVTSPDVAGLSIITGIDRAEFIDAPEESTQRISYALDAIARFSSDENRPTIGEIHLDLVHGITLITYENAIAIHLGTPHGSEFEDRYQAFDSAFHALNTEERAAARAFRIADHTPSDRVTVAFAGN